MSRRGLPAQLESERLWLRAPRVEDAEAMLAALRESFEELRRWMDWAREIPCIEREREILAERAAAHGTGQELSFLMWDKEDGELVGSCGLPRPRWDERAFEIGYWVRTSRLGRGYATESARRLARLGFDELGAGRMEICTSRRNLASARVAERAGFRLEHTRIADGRDPDGSPRDTRVFALYDASEIAEFAK